MPSKLPRRTRLIALGVVVLLIGCAAAGFLYSRSLRNDQESDDDVLALQKGSAAYDQAVQRNVGPVGQLMSQGWNSFLQLGQPRPLAIIVMLVSCLTAGGLFQSALRTGD